jgi:hypothetical protein
MLRLERVDEAGLPDTRGTGEDGDPLTDLLAKPVESLSSQGADPYDLVPNGLVHPFELLG